VSVSARPPAWVGPRGIAALCGLAVVAAVASIELAWPVVVAAAVAIAIAALAADAAAIARAPEIARAVPAQLMLARAGSFVYRISNRNPVALRFGICEAPVEKLAVDIAPAYGRVKPLGRAEVTIAFVPRERGQTQIGVGFAWFESPLGLVRRRLRFGEPIRVRVRPDLSALERGSDIALRTRLIDAGLRRIRRRGIGSEFESLREYTRGDPFRSIDWKATARRGKVMVAQYEIERSQQLIVALDAGRLMSPRLGDRRKLDYAISAALAMVAVAQQAADRVGLHAFAGTTLAALMPRAGAAQSAALTDALSDLEPHFEESDYERAALELRRRYAKRSLIVVFTDLFDPAASSAVLASLGLLAPHHLVLVVLMNDAAIADVTEREPRRVTDVYRAGVGTRLADERARAVALLRERGIGVVDVPARELTLALLDAYVDVKTRGRL
jgi:uncharacterized protein (DUF58 family)